MHAAEAKAKLVWDSHLAADYTGSLLHIDDEPEQATGTIPALMTRAFPLSSKGVARVGALPGGDGLGSAVAWSLPPALPVLFLSEESDALQMADPRCGVRTGVWDWSVGCEDVWSFGLKRCGGCGAQRAAFRHSMLNHTNTRHRAGGHI